MEAQLEDPHSKETPISKSLDPFTWAVTPGAPQDPPKATRV